MSWFIIFVHIIWSYQKETWQKVTKKMDRKNVVIKNKKRPDKAASQQTFYVAQIYIKLNLLKICSGKKSCHWASRTAVIIYTCSAYHSKRSFSGMLVTCHCVIPNFHSKFKDRFQEYFGQELNIGLKNCNKKLH